MYPADRELTPTSFESITSGQPVSREPEGKPSMLRRVGRVAKWTGIVAVTAVAAALIFINTSWGKEFARARIEKALQKKVNGTVTVGAIDYTFLFSEVEIRDLHIADASGAPAIALDRVAVDLDRGSLVSGAPVLDRVEVRGLDIDSRHLAGLFVPSDRKPKHIRVNALEITDSSFTKLSSTGKLLELTGLELAGSVDADGINGKTSVDLASLAATLTIDKTRELAVELGATELSIDKSDGRAITAELSELVAGPISIAKISASTSLADGQLRGDQAIALSGLSVAASELAELLGRPVLGGDVTADLSITGPADKLVIDGAIETAGGSLSIDGSVDAGDLGAPSYAVEIRGDEIRTAKMLAPKPRSLESQLHITLTGKAGDANIALDAGASVLDLGDRKIAIDGVEVRARRAGGALTLDSLAATALGVEIKASGALSADRQVTAAVAIDADPIRLRQAAADLGIAIPAISKRPIALRATATGNLDTAIDVAIDRSAISVAGGRATIGGDARLAKTDGKMKLTRADIAIALSRIDLESAARLAGRTPKVAGTLGGEISIRRRGDARSIRYDLGASLAKPNLALTAAGTVDGRRATAKIRSKLANIEASLPLARRGGKRTIALDRDLAVEIDIPATRLDELFALLPAERRARLRAKLSGGKVAAKIALGGTAHALHGTIALDADAELVKLAGKAVELDGDIAITSADGRLAVRPDVAVAIAGVAGELAEITGAIDLGSHVRSGRLDLRSAARGAALDLDIDIHRRGAKSLAAIRSSLAKAGGAIDGHIAVTGTPKAPQLDGGLSWTGFQTAAGTRGGARLDFAGSPTDLVATIGLGARDGATIRAEIKRGASTDIKAKARARGAKLAEILPALGRDLRAELGTLDWNMDADLSISGGALASADISGHLDVSGGAVQLAGNRRIRDIGLRVVASADRVEIARLSARESDAQEKNRNVAITGALELAGLKPHKLALDIRANDWLVHGGSMGMADAPRASVDADLAVAVDMSKPVWAVVADVKSLQLDNATRYDRAHVAEALSINRDVMFIDDPGVEIGKLAPVRPVATTAAAEPRKRRPMDVTVRFAKPARIVKAPLDIRATGELKIKVRADGVATRGELAIVSGKLSLFGHLHELQRGRILFDDAHPRGELDLVFARELHPAVARQLAGDGQITVTFSGPLANRKVTLGGAGAGGFEQTLAWENAGRGMYYTRPGLPASASVQAPRGEQPLVLTFIQTNLPHMHVLDRFSAWSEPGRDRGSYGRVEHFEGERYARENDNRVKVVARPETLGRSRAEVHLDHLWINNENLAVGAGVRAGSRRGGGVGLFLEWSSQD